MLQFDAHLQKNLPTENTFDWLLNCGGKVYREIKNRRTAEIVVGDRNYFIKIHRGCGWGEIFKNLVQFRAPVISARTEWEAIERLQTLRIPTLTVTGKGERGHNPARRESFVITDAMEGMISLEDLTRDWGCLTGGKRIALKRMLLQKIAVIARTLHENGLNHRDFYLCHFLVKNRDWLTWEPSHSLELFLIDLHRVQQRSRVPRRWQVKDLGGLLFSAFGCGLTSGDLLSFISLYRQQPWREVLRKEKNFWRRVWRTACKVNTETSGSVIKPPRIAGNNNRKAG